jgi:hypothetical protein
LFDAKGGVMAPINMPPPHADVRLTCDGCRWFRTGFKGQNCRKTRQVETTTHACMEFIPYRPGVFDSIQSDKYVRDLEKTLEVFTDQFLKSVSKEVDQYVVVGTAPRDPESYLTDEQMAGLAHRFQVCQSYLDRVLDLRNTLSEKRGEMQSLAKDAQAYLFGAYTETIRGLKNDIERMAFYRHATPALYGAIDKLETVLEKLDRAYQNLKDTHFNLARTQDAALAVWNARIQTIDSQRRSRV